MKSQVLYTMFKCIIRTHWENTVKNTYYSLGWRSIILTRLT